MFTGLIQETGIISDIESQSDSRILAIKPNKVLKDLKVGDSIAIDGACQTVIQYNSDEFRVFVSSETLAVTTFSKYKIGTIVNLERTLRLCDRLDGHLVSGHVDGIAQLSKKNNVGDTTELYFDIPDKLTSQVVKKGSVTINGVSLTVADIVDNTIKIAVIPHTLSETNLNSLKIGDNVNIETDMIGKYVEKYLLSNHNSSNIDMNFLERNGFL